MANAEDRIDRVYRAVHQPLDALYPDQQPFHWGTLVRWADGGPDPLDGVSVYWNPAGHWHYFGFGLSELGEKESGIPEISGWGCELTFRLAAPTSARAEGDHDAGIWGGGVSRAAMSAPTWPLVLLNDIARYVFGNRAPLRHGHYIERRGAPYGERLGLIRDPALPDPIETPNGRFDWLEVILLSPEQFEAFRQDDGEAWAARQPDGWHIALADSGPTDD